MAVAKVLRLLGIARGCQPGVRKRLVRSICMLEDSDVPMKADGEMGQPNGFDDSEDDSTRDQISGRILSIGLVKMYFEIGQVSGSRFQRRRQS